MYQDKLLIAGELVKGDLQLEVINPATGLVFATVGCASPAQLDRAVDAARAAQPSWDALGAAKRTEYLLAFADGLHAEAEQIARAITSEQGKPLAEAAGEVALTEMVIRAIAQSALGTKELQNDETFAIEAIYRPLGVVAGITPWNFPLAPGLSKGVSAMVMGNSYIWKPAPTTPITALVIAAIAQRTLPAGVMSVLIDQNDLGALISAHPGIDKVSFTGSTATGKKVLTGAAETLKRVTLELGGNDAAIVLDDVDVEKVAQQIFGLAFYNAGQVCIAIKRVYAHQSIYDRLCDALARFASELVVGEGSEQGVQMGPLQNVMQYEKAKDFLKAAHADGAVVAGGSTLDRDGYFIEPTIVRDIADDSRLVREEQFAPILPVLSFDDTQDALARANNSIYGLGASVWSGDKDRARTIARQLNAGTVWVNQHCVTLPHVPFGGAKQSGFGVELGEEGLAEFAQLHVINVAQG